MPRAAESTWPATTTLPNASPAFDPPVHHPTCRTSSGMASAPSGCRPTGTTGATVPPGSTNRVGAKTAGRAGMSVPSVAEGTAPWSPDGAGAGAPGPAKGGTTGAGATARPGSDRVADPVVDPGPAPVDATVAASAVVVADPSPAAANTPATARAPPYTPIAANPADRRAVIRQPSFRVPPRASASARRAAPVRSRSRAATAVASRARGSREGVSPTNSCAACPPSPVGTREGRPAPVTPTGSTWTTASAVPFEGFPTANTRVRVPAFTGSRTGARISRPPRRRRRRRRTWRPARAGSPTRRRRRRGTAPSPRP